MLALALAAVLAAAPASDLTEAKRLYADARVAYDAGRFDEALTGFQAAYQKKPLPGFLFNLGQCERQLGHDERAIFFFQRFLESTSPTDPARSVATELLAESRARLSAREAAAAAARQTSNESAAHLTAAQDAARQSAEAAAAAKAAAEAANAAAQAGATRPAPPPVVAEDTGPPWLAIGVGVGVGAVAIAGGIGALVWWSAQPSLGFVDIREETP